MVPFRLLIILHSFVLSTTTCFCGETVSVSVSFEVSLNSGSYSRMTKIHMHSSNFSNPSSPPFPSQPFVSLWEPCSEPYLKLI